MERHRVEAKDSFAGLVHRCDLLFEPARGAERAQLIGGVDHDWYGVSVVRCLPANLGDKAAAAHVCACGADTDNAIDRGDAAAGTIAQDHIVAASRVVVECIMTDRRVEVSGGVAEERFPAKSCVLLADGVVKNGEHSIGRVLAAGFVKFKRGCSLGYVFCAGGVKQKRCSASGRI